MKRKKSYVLFYDEAFHDRKLTEKKEKGELNIENNELSDNFISVALGFNTHQSEQYLQNYLKFERNTKKTLGLPEEKEFKGTIVNKKNFKYGLSSFNKDALKIYSEYFDLFNEEVIIQLSSLNKFELIIISILQEIHLNEFVNNQNFMYSIVKFLNTYKNKNLISILFDTETTTEQAINVIINLLSEVSNFIKGVQRKKIEEHALQNIKLILENSYFKIQTATKYTWDYSRSIDGICLLLDELKIKETSVTLTIDREDNTVIEAQKRDFKKVISADSAEFPCVRFADILCNFIGRMLKSIDDEYLEDWDSEETKRNIEKKRILSEQWFKLTEEEFDLYKKIAKIFHKRKDIYWTVQTGIYAGHTSVFFSLIYYIGLSFNSYNDYKEICLETHRENFNTMSVQREFQLFEPVQNY